MIRFRPQLDRPGMHHVQEEILENGEPYIEAEPAAEPIEEYDAEHIGKAKNRRQIERQLTVLQREKMTDWGSRQIARIPEAVGETVQQTKDFLKKDILDKALPGALEAVQYVGEKVRDSVPVKFVEESGIGMRMRLFMFNNGPSAALGPKIAKGQSEIEYLKQRQQQDAYEYDRVSKNFKGQGDVSGSIKKAKDEKNAYWQDRIDRAERKKKAVEEKLQSKNAAMEKVKDAFNNNIDNAIKKLEVTANYPENKKNQAELIKAIGEVEAELNKSRKIYKEFQDIQAQLLKDFGIANLFTGGTRSEDDIFDNKRITESEKDFSVEQKSAAEQARQAIKNDIKVGKFSTKNIAEQTQNKIEEFGRQIEILEDNLKKLRKSKDKVDSVCIKTEHRVANWNVERQQLGIDKKNNHEIGKGDYVSGKISETEALKLKPSIDAGRKELRDFANSPEHWFGKDIIDKVKADGIDAVLNEGIVAKGLIKMRELAVQTVFDMDKVKSHAVVEKINAEELRDLDKMKLEMSNLDDDIKGIKDSIKNKEQEARDFQKNNKNPSDKIRSVYDKMVIKTAELKEKLEGLEQKKKELSPKLRALEAKVSLDKSRVDRENAQKDQWAEDREFIQKEVIDKMTSKIPEDFGSKQRSWNEFKEVLFAVYPDLEQYEENFANKDVKANAPGMPENVTPDAVDKAAERILEDVYGIDGLNKDTKQIHEKLIASFSAIESDPSINDADKKEVMNVILSQAVENIISSDEQGVTAAERSILLIHTISTRGLSSESNKILVDSVKEQFKSQDVNDIKLFESFVGALRSSVNEGIMENEEASATCLEIYDAYRGAIENGGGTVSSRARKLADLALRMTIKTYDIIGDGASAQMFDNALKYLEHNKPHAIRTGSNAAGSEASDEVTVPERFYINKYPWSGGKEKLSDSDLSSNAEFSETLDYIQREFLKSGLVNAQGMTPQSMEQRKNDLLIKAKSSPEKNKNFGYLIGYVRELAANNHFEDAQKMALEARNIAYAENDPYKLMQLGVALRESGNPDMDILAMDIYDHAFNLVNSNTEEGMDIQLKVIDCMLSSDTMVGEHFEADIKDKFDSIFESNQGSLGAIWYLYKNVRSMTNSNKFKNHSDEFERGITKKILLQAEKLVLEGGEGEFFFTNLEGIASHMRDKGMEKDAKRVEKFVEEEKKKINIF